MMKPPNSDLPSQLTDDLDLLETPSLQVPMIAEDEHIFANGYSYFMAMLQDIQTATQCIEIETYIFHNDPLGQRIACALIDAAKRGVQVRILVDGAGSPKWTTAFARKLETAGAHTRVFHPFPWHLWNWSRSVIKAPTLLKIVYLMLKINFRNHRKVCLIDNKIAYIGSCNISKCHLDKKHGGESWRDIGVRVCNLHLTELIHAFDCAWYHRTISERIRDTFQHIQNDPPFRLNYTRHRRRFLYKHLLQKISRCKKKIWITNAYFVPDNFLLKRLKEAAERQIDVRILLPSESDVMMMPLASSTFYFSLLKAGVRIFEYLPSVLHAKTFIVDDWMLVGSSNLNHRSLLHDLEVDVNIHNNTAKKQIKQLFLNDLTHSKELSLMDWHRHRPWRQRLMGRLVLYLKYWI